jgi:drug/metabolite transporter (DMT)-like permease
MTHGARAATLCMGFGTANEDGDTLNLGIGLALLCAAATQLGFLCKHRGATQAPPVDMRHPLRSARALFRSSWFALGMVIALGAWILHVAALALAPLSVVQVVLSTGVVMLAVLGQRLFGCAVGGREWAGVVMTAAGLTLLVLTLPHDGGHGGAFALPALVAFEAGMLALGTLLIAAPRLGAPAHHHGAVLGAAAGTLFGVSDVALKALTGLAGDGPLAVLASPWVPVALLASVLAFLASARGFQQGDAVPVIACTSTAANITVIGGGILVFGDALAAGALLGVQIAAFALVACAALVTPSGHGPVAAKPAAA